jgi:hypothetical protein
MRSKHVVANFATCYRKNSTPEADSKLPPNSVQYFVDNFVHKPQNPHQDWL